MILEEQPDYYKKVQGVTPKGHMNIEVRDGRGRITLNVDNLRINPNEEKLYKACLVGTDKKNYVDVDLGVIVLNERGKGTLEWRFDPTSVGGTSLSIEKFNNILVREVDTTNENNDIVVPLSGYIYKKDGSLVKLMKRQAEKELPRKKEIEFKQILEEPKAKEENIPKDTYVAFEEANIEEKIEETKENEDIDEKVDVEEIKDEEVEGVAIKEEIDEEVQETSTESVQDEIQEDIEEEAKEVEIDEAEIEVKEIEEEDVLDKYNVEAKELEIEDVEADEDKSEQLRVEDLSIEDIAPLDIELDELGSQNIDVEEKQEYEEQIEQEEQVDSTEAIWIDLETGKELEHEEDQLSEDNFIEVNDIPEDDYQNDGFIKMGDDFVPNHQVTYDYGDYIDNTYGNKINKMDVYTETVKNYSMQVANYTMDILKFFQKVEPFKENLRGYTWWEIQHNDEDFQRGFLPFYNYLANVYYPYPLTSKTTTCQSMIEKYGHYVFGTVREQEDIKYYVYGVPGRFNIAEHPYNGATGFNTWLKDKNSSDELGYWLIYIDALSGKIVNPINPTIPIR